VQLFSTMQRSLVLLFASLAITQVHGATKTDAVVNEGIAAYKAGNYDLAIAKYTAVLKENPIDPITYNDRGLAYKEKKDYAHAIADFTEALRFKQDWYFYYNRGTAYSDGGDEKSAIADFTRALKVTPRGSVGYTDCLMARAHSYFSQEQAEPAMTDLNAAIKLGVKEPDAYVLRGILHKIRHDYALSLADYEKAIALDPKDARSFDTEAYLLAVCPAPKYRDGRKAVAYAIKACELTGWKASGDLETLAAAYAEDGQYDEAIKWQKKAAQLAPGDVDAKRLGLYRQKKPFRDLNRKEEAVSGVSDLPNKVSIEVGQRVSAQFEIRGDDLVNPKISAGAKEKPSSLLLHFYVEKNQRTLRLTHTFWRSMRVRCLARLKGYDTYFETDILPVPVETINPEIWSDPIEELVLFDFKLTGPDQKPETPEQESPVASIASATIN
jgi:tetratricopeptide (TPR) repeat protein